MKKTRAMWSCLPLLMAAAIGVGGLLSPSQVGAEEVSFFVDPDTIDDNMDGFITDDEFQPVGSDGVVFDLLPTNNLVGADRFLLSDTNGLHYGGGGGSTLSFDFSVSDDIELESYTLGNGFFLGNPVFNISEGASVLSMANTSNSAGDTHAFAGGPISLNAGTTYTFETTTFGAGVQSYMGTWTYSRSAVPEPGSLSILGLVAGFLAVRRRRT